MTSMTRLAARRSESAGPLTIVITGWSTSVSTAAHALGARSAISRTMIPSSSQGVTISAMIGCARSSGKARKTSSIGRTSSTLSRRRSATPARSAADSPLPETSMTSTTR